ncbi:hypothetical protein [Streptomyces puniciscabiei]|uniref:hypothetical protein n=1 Tax=Streptomyces puniciscabiei TaxID=164348 RepID=UPI0037AF58AC
MTFPAAFLGTTVRVLRTAAGRRALQLTLLVGGLFALGFLCGEQAHAADGAPAPALSPAQATSVRSEGVAARAGAAREAQAARAAQAVPAVQAEPAARAVPAVQVVRTAVERVTARVQTVGGQAVTPVRDVLTTVSRTVETTAAQAVADRPQTAAPSLPLPGLTQVTGAPAQLTPSPKSTAPGSRPNSGTAAPAPVERPMQGPAHAQGRTAVGAPAPGAVYGPVAAAVPQRVAHTFARHGAAVPGVPGRPAPGGDSDGVLGKQAADGSASRHGDAHAVTLDARAPLWLAPGATARVGAPRTRDRHRDIPVFPG